VIGIKELVHTCDVTASDDEKMSDAISSDAIYNVSSRAINLQSAASKKAIKRQLIKKLKLGQFLFTLK
jgi:hypothetical protein